MLNRLIAYALTGLVTSAAAQGAVYRCPGPPVLYTDAITAKEASERGCRTIEGTPITVVHAPKPRSAPAVAESARAPGEGKVDGSQQKARDTERRRVLETELRGTEERLTAARAEFNGGQGERRAEERNYQKYLDRMAALKDSIARLEGDVQALKREISKLPG